MKLPRLFRPRAHAPERLPAAPAAWFLPVASDWTQEQCLQLIQTLRPGQRLGFFDPDFPSVSDPGGYVQVQRGPNGCTDGWQRYTANHGWSTQWEATTPEALAAVLYAHRAAQGPGVQFNEARSPTKEAQQ
ncbi:hypothetical protein [Deinococcus altitudinis]|uniref:hypothetical protein n=1 Tax=Deinococcus altitudinis TaxID=468914 RepID=UPI00389232BD